MSRRSALAYAATVASAVVLGACVDVPSAPDSRQVVNKSTAYWAFMFHHDESVYVVISAHDDLEKFNLTVRQDGKDVEFHEGLTDKTVGDIDSEYVQVSYIDPPTAG
jgi:hypothetical protein